MAGLVPAIHVFAQASTNPAETDARNTPGLDPGAGHDETSRRAGRLGGIAAHRRALMGPKLRPSAHLPRVEPGTLREGMVWLVPT